MRKSTRESKKPNLYCEGGFSAENANVSDGEDDEEHVDSGSNQSMPVEVALQPRQTKQNLVQAPKNQTKGVSQLFTLVSKPAAPNKSVDLIGKLS
jgi:hypothetical protein